MKKVLSMVLALALVLTTLVVPMTVSAADETFTISYNLVETETVGTIYPGETITVEVYANASAKVDARYELYIPYPTDMMLNEAGIVKSGNFVKFVEEDATPIETAENGGTKVGEYSFTVPADGAGAHSIPAISDETDSYFTVGFEEIVPTAADESFTVVPCDATVTVTVGENAGQVIDGTAITVVSNAASDVKIDVASVSSAISNLTANDVSFANGDVAFSAFGTYIIKFTTDADGEEHVYTVIYKSNVLADVVIASETASAQPGDTVTVNVSVDQLAGNKVEVLTFDVVYDDKVFAAPKTTSTGVTIVGNAVTFTAEENAGIAEDAIVAALEFEILDDANKVGVYEISIENEALAVDRGFAAEAELVDTEIDDVVAFNIYSADAITVGALSSDAWLKEKTIPVSMTEGWSVADGSTLSVAYKSYANIQTGTPAAEIYNAENEIELSGNVPVTTTAYYYVVARFGKAGNYEYVILAEYTPEQLKIDLVAPEIEMAAWGEDWKNAEAFDDVDGIEFTVTDAGAGVTEISYEFDEDNKGTAVVTEGKAYVPVVTDKAYESISVSASDSLGNGPTTKTFNIKYDDVAPEIALNVGAYSDAGIPITVTLTPATGQSAQPESVSVQLKGSEDPATVVNFVDGAATYTAKTNGIYVFTVIDEAGNETIVESETINVGKLSKLKAPTFKISSAETAVAGSLKTDEELTGLGVATNGSFTYLTVIPADDEQGADYTTTYTLTKNDEAVAGWAPGTALVAEVGTNDAYKLTVKTAMNVNGEADYQIATYTFSIADRANFKTVNGDNKYRLTDWMIMQLMVGEDKNFATDAATNYTGGYFAGDVNADLVNDWVADSAEMLGKIKSSQTWKTYNFAIYNGLTYSAE